MKRIRRQFLTVLLCLVTEPWLASCIQAQSPPFESTAAQVDKEIKSLKPHRVAVADFRSTGDNENLQGHYLAWLLSQSLNQISKRYKIAEHKSFDEDLKKANITQPVESVNPSLLRTISSDLILTGTLEREGNDYILHVTPIQKSSSKPLPALAVRIQPNEFFDSMATPFPPDTAKAGRDGTSLPACIHCPDPSYSEWGRAAKMQGSCVLLVLISKEGTAQQIRPAKFLGYGLDERAYDSIKKWTFRPARSKDGTPVAAIVPVEVTFRLY